MDSHRQSHLSHGTVGSRILMADLDITQAFPPSSFQSRAVCILQAIKNWTVGLRPGNEARIHVLWQ